jgi:predicted ABC-type sugar transport system permease subunit
MSLDDSIDNKRNLVSSLVCRCSFLGEEVLAMSFVSKRVQLGLVSVLSVVAAVLLGGCPWGP